MAGEEASQQSLIWVMWEISGDKSEKISVGEDRMEKMFPSAEQAAHMAWLLCSFRI